MQLGDELIVVDSDKDGPLVGEGPARHRWSRWPFRSGYQGPDRVQQPEFLVFRVLIVDERKLFGGSSEAPDAAGPNRLSRPEHQMALFACKIQSASGITVQTFRVLVLVEVFQTE